MQPRQQPVQDDEAGATAEDAVEPGAQDQPALRAGRGPVGLEIGIEVPNQAAHASLGAMLCCGRGLELVHQPFGVDPTQRMLADRELSGVVAQNDGIAQEIVGMLPQRAPSVAICTGSWMVAVSLVGGTMPSRFRNAIQAIWSANVVSPASASFAINGPDSPRCRR